MSINIILYLVITFVSLIDMALQIDTTRQLDQFVKLLNCTSVNVTIASQLLIDQGFSTPFSSTNSSFNFMSPNVLTKKQNNKINLHSNSNQFKGATYTLVDSFIDGTKLNNEYYNLSSCNTPLRNQIQ